MTSQAKDAPAARGDLFDPACPTRRLLDRIGTKWTSMAVKVLAEAAPGEVRFAELLRRMPGVSQKMLSVTLRSLVRDGLVARRVEPSVPPGVHYRLTGLGLSLETVLAAVRDWAEEHMAEVDRANERHTGQEAGPEDRPGSATGV
ncbi:MULTISPECIES: winged helix-turn-helix transcriptional regulator [Streptomyces]|uniref:Helix-turn-helix domain-containing protein n=1 Tax=Streptomyces bangladeshensis TaxID=295352 RepID=A0ABN3C643_9ACTN|nr:MULTISPECIES: helix-turn-helix domain-containing protein [unclassified Streptomyces]MYU27531.1 transcriptional regulator [Streptomyces sp. SID7810]OYP19439.1 transcriptional regulator [Streptomyces sp. FBKL.4005]BCM72261.1 putative transcriptional regulator [Streptomyces sp. EAS-AB2608]CUW26390.1 putative HTH-type transcriptional regulator YybR [Streptomyces reticuli]